jgi:enolase-phosphatase E1
VKDELFPYARRVLTEYLRIHGELPKVRPILERLKAEVSTGDLDTLAGTLQEWIDEDRKHPDLKALQGLIWDDGYRSGAFRGHLYPDVLPFWEQARESGLQLAIYSSGSVQAQRLLLQHSVFGDVAHLIDRHFDTGMGAKAEVSSYVRIAQELELPAGDIRFFSDVVAELDAARAAGFQTCRVVRPGVPAAEHSHPEISDFATLSLALTPHPNPLPSGERE